MAVSPTLVAVIPNEGAVIKSGDTVAVAPRELTIRFDEGQVIDASTLGAITVTRTNFDDLFNGNDVNVPLGFVGIGEKSNEVVIRFSENLPDDKYRVRIGAGLKNSEGDAFNNGSAINVDFNLDLGALVTAVVPQPVSRSGNALTQSTNTIAVYFNNDDLDATAAQTASNYQLIRTGGTATNLDDIRFNPVSVVYDNIADKAILTFAPGVLETAGTYRLRIGNNDPLPLAPTDLTSKVGNDDNSSFGTAINLGSLFTAGTGLQSAHLTAQIDAQPFTIEFPGMDTEPGHRQPGTHISGEVDTKGGIVVQPYSFPPTLGGQPNIISEDQKQRFRDVFALISEYAGIQFVEVASGGYQIAVGDIRYITPLAKTGPRGVGTPALTDPFQKQATVMNGAFDWGNNTFGGDFFQTAMAQVGQYLRLGDAADLPPPSVMGSNANGGVADGPIGTAETVFPGDADIVHLQELFRPDVKDIDAYKFSLARDGVLSLETLAQRRTDNTSTYLDSLISVYDASGNLIARNDDYFGRDSYLKLNLAAGTYYVAVSASGNDAFDLHVNDSGLGGKSQGAYDLRMNFEPNATGGLTDAGGVQLDGDADGKPGGEYNFWFKTQASTNSAATNHVIWVDKATTAVSQDGTLARPFSTVALALAKATDGDIVRIVGNNIKADGSVDLVNAVSYNIGKNTLGQDLADGASFDVPKGVTVMIDAGAVFRLQGANIDVGRTVAGINRDNAALQVLGTNDTSVYFTSYNDESTGKDPESKRDTTPARGDWGGLVFRANSDLENAGIFLNYVNHADIRWGGGIVSVDSVPDVYTPIYVEESRPALSYNTIRQSAAAAISADPNSFEETVFGDGTFAADYGRVGPAIHGNLLGDNSINGLFVRISTPAIQSLETLSTFARFDDTDIVHVLAETLLIDGDAGGLRFDPATNNLAPRPSGRLAIDPGIVLKLAGARIETAPGSQFLAEGTAENPVIMTSTLDDSYGRSGAFDTTADGSASAPAAGDWAGMYFGPTSSASIDHALIAYGGGYSGIDGGSARFNAIEIQSANVRVANSTIQNNADGADTDSDTDLDTARDGHLENESAAIFVRGAQPDLIDNIIRNNGGSAISINVNALNSELNNDDGRSTGKLDRQGDFYTNTGALIVGNRLDGNEINGLEVRGGTLTTQVIFDDADIVHVVRDEIAVGNLHTYGGLRLQSKAGQSLVVKLDGDDAGFTASGLPLDIVDRIGGTVQIIGQPGAPVVLTSLFDSTVGAGLKPDGTLQKNTVAPGTAPAAGDWRSVKLDRYSNDRNVAQVLEIEQNYPATGDLNGSPNKAQFLGQLAPNEKSGDDNVRLGYEVIGSISQTYDPRGAGAEDDRPADVDVYSFQAKGGTEVWLDIDRTAIALDTVVELIDANGSVIARSNNSLDELAAADLLTFNSGQLVGSVTKTHVMQRDIFGGQDFFSTNPRDPGMRVVLSGSPSVTGTYFVRVRANSASLTDTFKGESYGKYQLQVRLRETDEFAGSMVQYADIRYATNGIEVIGKPESSPILGESTDNGNNNTQANAQKLGNLLASNLNTLGVSGVINPESQVDWYEFTIDPLKFPATYGALGSGFWPTVFDLDYADGLGKVNASLAVFDATGKLVYISTAGGTDDDLPRPLNGGDTQDLTRGSFGTDDPYLGSVDLRQGGTFYVAVSSSAYVPLAMEQFYSQNPDNPLFRLEPVAEYNRVFTNRVGSQSGEQNVGLHANEFHLGDVVLYVNTGGHLYTVDPLTGAMETVVTGSGNLPDFDGLTYGDLAMRNDGRLFILSSADSDAAAGNYQQISTGDGSQLSTADDGIETLKRDNQGNLIPADVGFRFSAYAFMQSGTVRRLFAVGSRPKDNIGGNNILFELDPTTGKVLQEWEDPEDPRNKMLTNAMGAQLLTAPTISVPNATDQSDPYNVPGDILDGQTMSVTGPGGTVTIEFNTGPSIVLKDTDHNNLFDVPVIDGETFTVNGVVFEFDQGAYLTAGSGALFADGDTFTITDSDNNLATFEFDLNNLTTAGNKAIVFTVADTAANMASKIVAAINNASLKTVAAATGARVTLVNDTAVDALLAPGLTVAGVGTAPGNIPVQYEESQSVSTVANAMVAAINTNTVGVTESFIRDRITLRGAASATVSSQALSLGGGDSLTAPVSLPVSVDAADSGSTIASRIAGAINSAGIGVTAIPQGDSVQVIGATMLNVSSPFTSAGTGGGGPVTGMAEVNGILYAVTSAGDLFRVDNIGSKDTIYNAALTQIGTVKDGGSAISFTGLARGPQNVEGGKYANLLFATDSSGNIWAFDTLGNLQPIFLNGATHVSTGVFGSTGLAFSTLDYNLWHTTLQRGGDDGHSGGQSYYFGLENPAAITTISPQPGAGNYQSNADVFNTYDLPGGAYGSLETDPFDLRGYSAADAPTLYFSYYYDAESSTIWDTARVFASVDGANWSQISNPFRNSDSWRQGRVDLSGFAGQSAVRLRFDFSTAGDMEVGENEYTGSILRAIDANKLRDGDTFTIDGTTFEFELGFTAITQPGKLTNDGDTLVVNGTTFEFNKTGGVSGGNVSVTIGDGDSGGVVAMKLANAINAQALGVTALLDEGVTITTRPKDEILDGDTITIDGLTYEFNLSGGVAPGHIGVSFDSEVETAEDVAEVLAERIEDMATSGIPVVKGAKITLEAARAAAQTGTSASVSANSSRINLANATTATETGTSVALEGDVGVEAGNVPVIIDTRMNATDVAQTMAAVMEAVFLAAAGNVDDPTSFQAFKLDGDQFHIIDREVTSSGPLPYAFFLPGDHPPGLDIDRFLDRGRGQNNAFEGLYLDDFIVGFAGRGEQAFVNGGSTANPYQYIVDPARPSPDPNIVVGSYDLEIRRGRTPNRLPDPPAEPFTPYPLANNEPDPIGRVVRDLEVPIGTDIRDRQATAISLWGSVGGALVEGETFQISDGLRVAVFEFDSDGIVGQTNFPGGVVVLHQPVKFNAQMTVSEVTTALSAAINDRSAASRLPAGFLVQADILGHGDRLELHDAASFVASASVSFQISLQGEAPALIGVGSDLELSDLVGLDYSTGDRNTHRPQGYTLIGYNSISDSLEFGVRVDSPVRDEENLGHPGGVRNLTAGNPKQLVPGVSIFSNLLVGGGDGGILISGDSEPGAAKIFGRITNNTIYGGTTAAGVGIQVTEGASPTITNNILANNATAIQVVNGPGTTLRSNLYQGNSTLITGGVVEPSIAGLTNFLSASDVLFVDAANRNFYIASGSKAIDSSSNSISERSDLAAVYGTAANGQSVLGIPQSPILAPNLDLLGQVRTDDPTVAAPTGLGLNVFKDRGAIDRTDFVGSSVVLVNPVDNDSAGDDQNPAVTVVELLGKKVTNLSFQLNDGTGVGISDSTVTLGNITFLRDGSPVPATDFIFSYDTTNDTVRLQAAAGIFADGTYTIRFNNTTTGIRDLANNPLRPNQADGTVQFTISISASALAPWQNPGNYQYATLDVNNSGFVSAIDAGIVYDYIKHNGIGALPLPAVTPPYLDVNGDGACTPVDLALIIDHLNRRAAGLLASFESSDSSAASMFESSSAVADAGDVAFGLSVVGGPDAASGNLFASRGQATAATTQAAAIDAAIDDYASAADLESIDLFVTDTAEADAFDSLFDEVDALLI